MAENPKRKSFRDRYCPKVKTACSNIQDAQPAATKDSATSTSDSPTPPQNKKKMIIIDKSSSRGAFTIVSPDGKSILTKRCRPPLNKAVIITPRSGMIIQHPFATLPGAEESSPIAVLPRFTLVKEEKEEDIEREKEHTDKEEDSSEKEEHIEKVKEEHLEGDEKMSADACKEDDQLSQNYVDSEEDPDEVDYEIVIQKGLRGKKEVIKKNEDFIKKTHEIAKKKENEKRVSVHNSGGKSIGSKLAKKKEDERWAKARNIGSQHTVNRPAKKTKFPSATIDMRGFRFYRKEPSVSLDMRQFTFVQSTANEDKTEAEVKNDPDDLNHELNTGSFLAALSDGSFNYEKVEGSANNGDAFATLPSDTITVDESNGQQYINLTNASGQAVLQLPYESGYTTTLTTVTDLPGGVPMYNHTLTSIGELPTGYTEHAYTSNNGGLLLPCNPVYSGVNTDMEPKYADSMGTIVSITELPTEHSIFQDSGDYVHHDLLNTGAGTMALQSNHFQMQSTMESVNTLVAPFGNPANMFQMSTLPQAAIFQDVSPTKSYTDGTGTYVHVSDITQLVNQGAIMGSAGQIVIQVPMSGVMIGGQDTSYIMSATEPGVVEHPDTQMLSADDIIDPNQDQIVSISLLPADQDWSGNAALGDNITKIEIDEQSANTNVQT